MTVRVYTSSVINAPVSEVWAKVRDFNGLPQWYPGVLDSEIENREPSDKVGCIRDFRRDDGVRIRERLLGLSDEAHSCSYCLLDPEGPMRDYVCTFQLGQITDGDRTFVEWFAEFNCSAEEVQELRQSLESVFQVGFDALKRTFGGP